MEVLSVVFMILMIVVAVILLMVASMLFGSMNALRKYTKTVMKSLCKLLKIKITFGD